MESKREIADAVIDSIIERRLLPADSREVVREVLTELSHDDALEELNVFAGNCYRNDPNHPRYDANRAWYPRVELDECVGC